MINEIVKCKNCDLCNNQAPLLDHLKEKTDVMWVGLSAVKVQDVETETPLSDTTRSGNLIKEIEGESEMTSFYKSNIVKCLPLKETGKIRYPSKKEMESCYFNLKMEIELLKPNVIFLLGKQVASFLAHKFDFNPITFGDDFQYKKFDIDGISVIPIHHPSYILIYKRKKVDLYKQRISTIIEESQLVSVF